MMRSKSRNGQILTTIEKKNEAPEFGFGKTTSGNGTRTLNRDGSSNIVRLGDRHFSIINMYHQLITMSWTKFTMLVCTFYFAVNCFFASLYYFIARDGLSGMVYNNEFGKILEIFFFSSQSLTTVGYGRINPMGHTASLIAAFESLVGLLGFALATGLLYGRFSRPTARIRYSKNLIEGPYKHARFPGVTRAVMFRIVNSRRNQLIEVESQVLFSYNEITDGVLIRRFQTLKLEVEKISYLAMTWTIVHPIDEASPLYGLTEEDYESVDAEFLVSIKAIDDTYVQQVYSRFSYKWDEIVFGSKFVSVVTTAPDGRRAIDLNKLDTYDPVEISQTLPLSQS